MAIQNSGANHLIFRTSWVYSARGHNFMKTMLRLGAEKATLSIVNDQHGSPTPARLIAQVTALALYRLLTDPAAGGVQGIYHLAPRGTTTWQEFASAIFQMAAEHGLQLKIDPTQVMAWPRKTTRHRPLARSTRAWPSIKSNALSVFSCRTGASSCIRPLANTFSKSKEKRKWH